MNLYEIDQRLVSLVDPETGELLDYEAFDRLQMERRDKIEHMALWVKDLTALAQAIKEESDKLTERRRAAERRADRLMEYIERALDGEKFSTARCKVTFHPSVSLEVGDRDALIAWAQESGHDDCLTYKPPEVSKTAVRELLKQGVHVPHVQLVKKMNVGVK